jgi:hypothetical protein
MRLIVLALSLSACLPSNVRGQVVAGREPSSVGMNSLINAPLSTSTLAVGNDSQPSIAESSSSISASTTYDLSAATGADRNASLLSAKSVPYT